MAKRSSRRYEYLLDTFNRNNISKRIFHSYFYYIYSIFGSSSTSFLQIHQFISNSENMTREFWILLGIGISLYIIFFGIAVIYGPRWVENKFNEKEKFLTDLVMKSEKTYKELEAELKVYKELNREKDSQLIAMRKSSDERDRKIEALSSEVKRLTEELSRVTHQLQDNNVLKVKSPEKILGIWPSAAGQQPLDQSSEAEIIYNTGYTFIPLSGEKATRMGVLLEIDRHRPTIIQVGGHGNKDGILLEDGISEPGFWGEAVRDKNIKLIILMSCESSEQSDYNIADALIREGCNAVISCSDEIPDGAAVTFVKFLYIKMSEGLPLVQAFARAKFSISQKVSNMINLRTIVP